MQRILPMVIFAAAALFGVRQARREWVRVNAELDDVRNTRGGRSRTTLRRDPETGQWRPSR